MIDKLITFLEAYRTLRHAPQAHAQPTYTGPPISLLDALAALFDAWATAPTTSMFGRKLALSEADRAMLPKVLAFAKAYQEQNHAPAEARRGLAELLAEDRALGHAAQAGVCVPFDGGEIAVPTTAGCGCGG
jgi:hypothetical protein